MENKDWETYFNNLNSDQHPEEQSVPRGESPDPAMSHSDGSPDDDVLREILQAYNPQARVEGWEKISASLDASDEAFDRQVRHRIQQYHPAYDPHSWAKFTKRFSAHKSLRPRLIAIKLSEAAAIFLLMLSVLHLGKEDRLKMKDPISTEITTSSLADASDPSGLDNANASHARDKTDDSKTDMPDQSGRKHITSMMASSSSTHIQKSLSGSALSHPGDIPLEVNSGTYSTVPIGELNVSPKWSEDPGQNSFPEVKSDITNSGNIFALHFLEQPVSPVEYVSADPIKKPTLVSGIGKKYFEFGMLAQADYNQLKMPEDRVNSNGEQIVFPLQGITSPGFGAGFTMAIGHPRWALETGVIYNAKTFKPGRELTVGNTPDNSKVKYDAMHMQLVSVPLQFRYRFDAKGRVKTYAIAGFGLHLIAQSDIDVKVDYNFPSLPEGADPNNNPSLARTIRQTQRISEDIRKDARFSNNSYISANLGLGVEYSLIDRKTIFLQSTYQYQVPNLRFSNHNGKHVLSLSLQAGVRTPFGV